MELLGKIMILRPTILLTFFFSLSSPTIPDPSMDSLGWMAGCWEGSFPNGRTVSEQWMKPAGNVMMGMSRTVKNGKTVAYEFIRLEQSEDGTIRYIARPSNQPEATFTLILHENQKAVFENQQHDFPQRIIYERISRDSLVARIEGTINGKERKSDFPYRKTVCD